MSKSSPLNILQLIDSLDAGGGERMSVHLANALSEHVNFSSLIATRRSGILENDILPKVKFFCLNKKSALDVKALFKLNCFVKKHNVNIVHAHSTSYFLATQLKIVNPKIKIIWHDHYGMSDNLKDRPKNTLIICSYLFNKIIAVNLKLKHWSKQYLKCKDVDYIQNFSLDSKTQQNHQNVELKGESKAFKIIHVANLRPQKDHLTALKAILYLVNESINISYHLVGNYDHKSSYYQSIINFIKKNNLSKHVFIYGSQNNISALLKQSNLGILSSISEGLPVSLIEYAQAKLPLVVTDVGQCKDVVGEFAIVVEPENSLALAQAIKYNISQPQDANKNAEELFYKIEDEFNPQSIIEKLIFSYKNILKN